MINIEIKTDMLDNKIKFNISEGEFCEFNYESLDKVIDTAIQSTEEFSYKTENLLDDYETLIKKIVAETRSEDFKNAVKEVQTAKSNYNQYKELISDTNQ